MRTPAWFFPVVLIIAGCAGSEDQGRRAYENELDSWRTERVERLKSKDGWLNLAGLYWLEEGSNTIGSDSGNQIMFPGKAPKKIGQYTLSGEGLQFLADPGSQIRSGDSIISEVEIFTDKSGVPTLLESGSLAWFIIERGDRFGIRLRDYEHPALREFQGIENYPADPDWIIEASFEPYREPKMMEIPTVLGTTEESPCPGILKFEVDGAAQVLYPGSAGEGLFIIFADATSGLETYGGGRFMYSGGPDKNGIVKLDFNRAYNPPCAFTPFATCPLPPRENVLTSSITAGEKFSGHH